jgi:hypothetical protein
MNHWMRHLILYLLFSILICSCNDHLKIEKNNDPQRYADSQFVGSWKITAVVSDIPWDWDNNGTTEKNIYAIWSGCQKDNLYTLVGDKTGTYKLNCNSTIIGSWLVVDALYLVYTPINLPPESEMVTSMTSVQFTSTVKVTLSNGQDAIITKTWSRQ